MCHVLLFRADAQVVNELNESYTREELAELAESRRYLEEQRKSDPNEILKSKFRNFLRIRGENKNRVTNELYREHIPVSVFGVSSDELASDLGMSENELMAELTETSSKARMQLPKLIGAILTSVEKIKRREAKRLEVIRSKFGCIFYGSMRDGKMVEELSEIPTRHYGIISGYITLKRKN